MANPLTDFLNSYAGQTTKIDTMTAQAQAELVKLYEDCYLRINNRLFAAVKGVNWWTYGKQTEIMKAVAVEIDRFNKSGGAAISGALSDIARITTTTAIKDINLFYDLKRNKTFHFDFNAEHAEQASRDAYLHIAAQTRRMGENIKTFLRQEATAVFRRASVEGISRKQAAKDLREQVLSKEPNFQFIDKAGRRWDSEDYFDMLTRTVMLNEARECYVNTVANEGKDLVRVSIHGTRCYKCAPYEGAILSITGATPGYETVASAMANGLFHPRCYHRMVVYDSDIDAVFKQVAEGVPMDQIQLPK